MPLARVKVRDTRGNVYLTLSEAAQFANLDSSWLRRKAKSGELRAQKIGRDWFTRREWVQTYLRTRKPRGRPRKIR